MNKRCVALTEEQYKEAVSLLRTGFELNGTKVKPNNRIATVAVLQGTLGLRLGDCLSLRMSSFIKDGDRYRLDIVEQKTKKARRFTTPIEVYSFIQNYALDSGISKEARLFDITPRQVERHLNKVFTKMNLPLRQYGSHSFRKFFITKVYQDNSCNIQLCCILLQHSSVSITQKYIGISQKNIEDALSIKCYTDEKSGKDMDREAMQMMISDIQAKRIQAVCAYKLDRFGRNATDLLNFIELLKENGVKLFCVDDKIEYDPTDETQYMTKFLIMFLSLMAELERNNIRQRVIVTKDSLSRHGFWLGGTAPYGFEAVRVPNDGIILEVQAKYLYVLKCIDEEMQLVESIYTSSSINGQVGPRIR